MPLERHRSKCEIQAKVRRTPWITPELDGWLPCISHWAFHGYLEPSTEFPWASIDFCGSGIGLVWASVDLGWASMGVTRVPYGSLVDFHGHPWTSIKIHRSRMGFHGRPVGFGGSSSTGLPYRPLVGFHVRPVDLHSFNASPVRVLWAPCGPP